VKRSLENGLEVAELEKMDCWCCCCCWSWFASSGKTCIVGWDMVKQLLFTIKKLLHYQNYYSALLVAACSGLMVAQGVFVAWCVLFGNSNFLLLLELECRLQHGDRVVVHF